MARVSELGPIAIMESATDSCKMHGSISRKLSETLQTDLIGFPAVAILGPRQVGKSTLAREFVKSSPGAVYLVLERGQRRIAVEIKASAAPKLSRGNHSAFADLQAQHNWTIAQVTESYPGTAGEVLPLPEAVARMRDLAP